MVSSLTKLFILFLPRLIFLMGFNRGFCSKIQPYEVVVVKVFYKNYVVSTRIQDRVWFIFEKVIYYINNQFNLFKGALKEVSAVKHKLMKDSLKKYLTKTYLYHLVTWTEDGFIFDKVIYSIVTPFNFF